MKDTFDIPSPCFVMEEQKLIDNLKRIHHVSQLAGVDLILAFKAFAMWGAFPIVKGYVKGATASSLNEVLLCNEKMGTKSHTYCVAYDTSEFQDIVNGSSHLTFNSLSQYDLHEANVPDEVSIGLRINPEWSDVKTELYNPASSGSRLGINSEALDHLPARVEGLHLHVLCESDSFALEQVLQHVEAKFGKHLRQVKWVNLGGGHLVTEKDYDTAHLVSLLKAFKAKYEVDLIMEPGSAFVWQTGRLYTTVLDVVKNGGVNTAIIDASFTCHMPDCLEMPYRPHVYGASQEKRTDAIGYRLGGVSCLAGDYLDTYWFDKEVSVGDQLIFEDMMHYTMVKTTMFNGIKHPSIGIQKVDGSFEVLRKFGYEDYRDRLS
ncbi:MAG: carboxynorspermidine decarboxylase [Bacteroidota bacterium]